MTIARKDRYYCAARREKGTCKAAFGIAAAEVENRVLGGLREILVGNEGLVEEFTTELKAELARLKKRTTSDQGAIRNDLAEVERGIGRCVDFIMSGDGTSGSVRERLTKLEDQKSILQAQLARSAVVIPPFLAGCGCRTYAAIFSFMAGVMPPMPIFGRSLL